MKKLAISMVLATSLLSLSGLNVLADDAPKKLFTHGVYFKLKNNSPEATKAFVASCKKYLSKHPGTVFYAAGTRDNEGKHSEVLAKDFDVALVIIFENKEAEEKYQVSNDHKQFIKENVANMDKVRVYDANVEQ
jgi:hypothetical protein